MNQEKPGTPKKDTAVRFAPCPTCRKACPANSKNTWRPFCSERCKMIDLGDWFEERNCIIGKSEDEEF